MIKLLIADDEPLIQAGLRTMIDWEEHGISITDIACNGAEAYEMIKRDLPDIVITDIKMPVMTGLELAKKCHDEGMTRPVFILLTNYEDFHYVKEALSYHVSDYLVKLELTPETLTDALERAISKLPDSNAAPAGSVHLIKEQFFLRLVMDLFDSEQQFLSQAENLGITFDHEAYITSYVEIGSSKLQDMTAEKQLTLYTSSLQVAGELISKYIPCHVLSLDTNHFCVVFFLDKDNAARYKDAISSALQQVSSMLFGYYSVEIIAGVGSIVDSPMQISSSYQAAKQAFSRLGSEQPFLFFEDLSVDTARSSDYKNHIVVNVKQYINNHIGEKLTLNKVAEAFNISPSYLSTLFSRNNDVGFSDYVNLQKIETAKKMMADNNLKIYEISDMLGFESSFYFSRVFKKVTGLSPRDYMNQSAE